MYQSFDELSASSFAIWKAIIHDDTYYYDANNIRPHRLEIKVKFKSKYLYL